MREDAPVDEIRAATRKALVKLVELAIDQRVAFVVIAGDLYDGDVTDYNTAIHLRLQFEILGRAGIRVFLIRGNHDAESKITKSLDLPGNVHLFDHKKARTQVLDDLRVAIHGQSYATQHISEDLSAAYPDPTAGNFNIGMLHTSAAGYSMHGTYAPCSVSNLATKGYDYWALGHIHIREVLAEDPWIVFSGNIQGRHIRETGNKGCSIVTVEDGQVSSVVHHDLDVVRWDSREIDVSECTTTTDVISAIADAAGASLEAVDDRLLAIRLTATGSCPCHAELQTRPEHMEMEARAELESRFGERVWPEKIRFRTSMKHKLEDLRERDDAIGEVVRTIEHESVLDQIRDDVAKDLDLLRKKLPESVRNGDELNWLAADTLDPELLTEARDLLLTHLMDEDGAE